MFRRSRTSLVFESPDEITLSLDDDDEISAELDPYSRSVLTLPCIY